MIFTSSPISYSQPGPYRHWETASLDILPVQYTTFLASSLPELSSVSYRPPSCWCCHFLSFQLFLWNVFKFCSGQTQTRSSQFFSYFHSQFIGTQSFCCLYPSKFQSYVKCCKSTFLILYSRIPVFLENRTAHVTMPRNTSPNFWSLNLSGSLNLPIDLLFLLLQFLSLCSTSTKRNCGEQSSFHTCIYGNLCDFDMYLIY